MKIKQKYYEITTIYECVEKLSIIISCNIWMICLELNWFFLIIKKKDSENVSTQKYDFERRLCAQTLDLQIF